TVGQPARVGPTARIYTYLPHDTFLVRPLAQTNRIRAGTQVGASWTGVYRPELKIARNGGDLAAIEPDQTHTVMATVYPDADLSKVVEAATRMPGATVVGADRAAKFARIRLRVYGASLDAAAAGLADIPDVFWVDVEGHRQLLNDTTIWVGQ